MNDNLKIICRTCMLETNNGKMLNEKVIIKRSYLQLSDIIMHCAAVEIITGDELPYIICGDCIQNALWSYNFRQKCEESDKKLREILIQQQLGDDEEKLFADMDYDLPNDDFNPDRDDMILENVTNAVNNESGLVREQKSADFQIRFQKLLESQVSANQDHGYNKKKKSLGSSGGCGSSSYPGVTSTNNLRQKVIKKISNQKSSEKSDNLIINIKESTNPFSDIIRANVSNVIKKEDTVEYNHTIQKSNNATEPLSNRLQFNVPDTTNEEDTICRVCRENFGPDQMKVHITTHKKFRCTSCKIGLVNYNGLRAHQLYFCKFADAMTIQANEKLDLRVENETSISKKVEKIVVLYNCRFCGNKFDTKNKLNKHYSEDHLGEAVRRCVCDYCGKTFSRMKNLTRHLLVHTNERPFPCLVCDKAFNDKSCLNSHMLLHTPLGTRELYECAICGHKNQRKGNLRIHLQTHAIVKAFKCIACSKEFKTRVALKNHTQTHLGRPRIHVCDICGKDFDKKSKLINHIKLHTGERPHKCEFCGKGFIQRYTLREHYKSRHPHAHSK